MTKEVRSTLPPGWHNRTATRDHGRADVRKLLAAGYTVAEVATFGLEVRVQVRRKQVGS